MASRLIRVHYMEDERWQHRDFHHDREADRFLTKRKMSGDRNAYSVLVVGWGSGAAKGWGSGAARGGGRR